MGNSRIVGTGLEFWGIDLSVAIAKLGFLYGPSFMF